MREFFDRQQFDRPLSLCRQTSLKIMFVLIFLVLDSVTAFASRSFNAQQSFTFEQQAGTGEKIANSWPIKPLTYTVVGNRSYLANALIDEYMSIFSDIIGIKIQRANHAIIFIVIDENSASDLFGNPEKYIAAGFQQDTIKIMQEKFGQRFACADTSLSDRNTDKINAFIISTVASRECIVPLLFDIFGIKNVTNRIVGLNNMCILYRARKQSIRTLTALTSSFTELSQFCSKAFDVNEIGR